uniref:Uncharacterized protein n=1 Tax=Triticum urartu TaxID=4572 RepID=A0A8R7U9B9_TRIUA
MRDTRCLCRSLDSISISVWNSSTPCSDDGLLRLTATLVSPSATPRYTLPNPPTPITSDSSNPLVADFISWSEKCRHMAVMLGLSVAALLPPDDLLTLVDPPYTGSHPEEECDGLLLSSLLLLLWYATKHTAATSPNAAAPPAAPPMSAPTLLGFSLNCPSTAPSSASASILEMSGFGPARLPEASLTLNTSRPLRKALTNCVLVAVSGRSVSQRMVSLPAGAAGMNTA